MLFHVSEQGGIGVFEPRPSEPWGSVVWAIDAVVPMRIETIADVEAVPENRGVELRILPSLWPLHDAVTASTRLSSMIRMRNARARSAAVTRAIARPT